MTDQRQPHERPSTLLTSLSPRSDGASSPAAGQNTLNHGGHGLHPHDDHKLDQLSDHKVEQADHGGHGRVGREDYDVEDLILDNESRRTMTRGIAQLAASRRATRHGRLPPST